MDIYMYALGLMEGINSLSISFKKRDYSSLADIAVVRNLFNNGWTGALVAVK